MSARDLLNILKRAEGDPALLALATVDLTYPQLADSARHALRSALEVAAVPHWCNDAILASLLNVSRDNAIELWDQLSGLTVVEPFPARGTSVGNVHESARRAIRHRLANTDSRRLRLLSDRAAIRFQGDDRPAGRVEWVYHLLVADPEEGADELERGSSGWIWYAGHEARFALSAALTELDEAGLLVGRSATWARVLVTAHRANVEGAARFTDVLTQLLSEAEASHDQRLVAEIQGLRGDVARDRGDLPAAQAAYEECLATLQGLIGQDPTNTGWQRELAIAHGKVVTCAAIAATSTPRRLPTSSSWRSCRA